MCYKVGWTLLVLSLGLAASGRILEPEYASLNEVCRSFDEDNKVSYGPCSVTKDHHENFILKQDVDASPGEWSYKGITGPEYWYKTYPTCGGSSQSPIDIHLKCNAKGRNKALKLDGYDLILPATLLRGKKNIDLEFDEEPHHVQPSVSGGFIPNGDSYEFAGLHFHWGSNNSVGSEHLINGVSYPAEAHFVHFNKKYGSLSEAADKPDGLLVLGFFLKVCETSTPGLHLIAEGMKAFEFEDKEDIHLNKEVSIYEILGYGSDPKYLDEYVFYQGSLTTPPCTENVLWHVFPKPISIRQEDLLYFRRVRSLGKCSKTYSDNFRPVQPLNGRKVLWNGENCNV